MQSSVDDEDHFASTPSLFRAFQGNEYKTIQSKG